MYGGTLQILIKSIGYNTVGCVGSMKMNDIVLVPCQGNIHAIFDEKRLVIFSIFRTIWDYCVEFFWWTREWFVIIVKTSKCWYKCWHFILHWYPHQYLMMSTVRIFNMFKCYKLWIVESNVPLSNGFNTDNDKNSID